MVEVRLGAGKAPHIGAPVPPTDDPDRLVLTPTAISRCPSRSIARSWPEIAGYLANVS
jgi:hypothetical protein